MTRSNHLDSSTERTDTGTQRSRGGPSRVLMRGFAGLVGLATVPTAAAHSGGLHAGTPHRVLLGVILVGVVTVGISLRLGRTRWANRPQRAITGVLVGAVIAMVGTIGVAQIQIEPIGTTPTAREWYPIFAGIVGSGIMTTSLLVGVIRWRTRPRYSLLGALLGLWVVYPVVMPRAGYTHPLGYLLVVAVPLAVGYIVRRDVSPALSADVLDRLSRRVGIVVAILFTVFFLFSAGLVTVTPDDGANIPERAFVTVASFADPLVVWPAVELYLPAVPLSGALSVGTALVIGLLAALIGINTGLATTVWQRDVDRSPTGGAAGAVATTGATACCCCGPAAYAIASAVLGASAGPLFWAFIDPASPVGTLFFAGAVALLTGSSVQLSNGLAESDGCELPN